MITRFHTASGLLIAALAIALGARAAAAEESDLSQRFFQDDAPSVEWTRRPAAPSPKNPSVDIRRDEQVVPAKLETPVAEPAESGAAQLGRSKPALSATGSTPVPLAKAGPRGGRQKPGAAAETAEAVASAGRMPSLSTLVGGTCALLLFLFGIAWVSKRAVPRSMLALPSEAVEVLGRAPLAKGQTMHLVRCGGKLLLVAVSQSGAKTLGEISTPAEVERLTAICQGRASREAGDSPTRSWSRRGSQPSPAEAFGSSADDRS